MNALPGLELELEACRSLRGPMPSTLPKGRKAQFHLGATKYQSLGEYHRSRGNSPGVRTIRTIKRVRASFLLRRNWGEPPTPEMGISFESNPIQSVFSKSRDVKELWRTEGARVYRRATPVGCEFEMARMLDSTGGRLDPLLYWNRFCGGGPAALQVRQVWRQFHRAFW